MKEKYVAAVLFPALTHCVLPHSLILTFESQRLQFSSFFKKQLGRLLHLSAGR